MDKMDKEHYLEIRRSIISMGQNVFKSAILINGGAAIAIMAFIGNIYNKCDVFIKIPLLANAVLYFAWGVFLLL